MNYLERLLQVVLAELHCRFDGLPLERAREQARELLEDNVLDIDDVLETFLGELAVCCRCGSAWFVCDMAEDEDESDTYYCNGCS